MGKISIATCNGSTFICQPGWSQIGQQRLYNSQLERAVLIANGNSNRELWLASYPAKASNQALALNELAVESGRGSLQRVVLGADNCESRAPERRAVVATSFGFKATCQATSFASLLLANRFPRSASSPLPNQLFTSNNCSFSIPSLF